MYDSIFFYPYFDESMAILLEERNSHIFSSCNTFLERVLRMSVTVCASPASSSLPVHTYVIVHSTIVGSCLRTETYNDSTGVTPDNNRL